MVDPNCPRTPIADDAEKRKIAAEFLAHIMAADHLALARDGGRINASALAMAVEPQEEGGQN